MDSFSFQTIHTIEARSNMLLEVTKQHLKLTDPQVFQMIQGLLKPTVEILAPGGRPNSSTWVHLKLLHP